MELSKEKQLMDEYVKLLILAYFKINQEEYSFRDLAKMLGTTFERLDVSIESLMNTGKLEYKDHLLRLTQKGRLTIMNKGVDYFNFDEKSIPTRIDPSKAVSNDQPYVPERFLSKL
jgi:predicted transcriptional regulator